MADPDLDGFCRAVEPLEADFADLLTAGVLCRIAKGDRKGRPYCTPRNPDTPTLDDFSPRVGEVRAGDLVNVITGRQHGIFAGQAEQIERFTDEELLRFRVDDPMSGHPTAGGFSITGGHHRINEISRRVQAGELAPDSSVRILFHD